MTAARAPGVLERRPEGRADASDPGPGAALPDGWSIAWTLAILALVAAALLAVIAGLGDPIRLLVLIPFALLAPGVAIARLVRLPSRIAEVAVGAAVGAAMSAVVAGALLVLGLWDAAHAVVVLGIVTLVALELDPRIPSRGVVWRDLGSATGRAIARYRARRSGQGLEAPADRAAGPGTHRAPVPAAAPRSAATPSAGADTLPPPPVAVVRRSPRRAPVSVEPIGPDGKRQPLGENPLESPALPRQLRSTIHGVVDDLAARKDAPSP